MKLEYAVDLYGRLKTAEEKLSALLSLELLEAGVDIDLNMVQIFLLVQCLRQGKSISPGEAYDRCYNGSNVSYNISLLERLGYIDKSPCDKDLRSRRLTLTAKGKAAAERAQPVFNGAEKLFGSHFSAEALQSLSKELYAFENVIPHTNLSQV